MKRLPTILIAFITILMLCQDKVLGQVVVCGPANSDILAVLRANAIPYRLVTDPVLAVKKAAVGGGVLFLPVNYPARLLHLPDSVFLISKQKRLRLYVEYGDNPPGLQNADTLLQTKLERGIVTTRRIKGLDSLSLLDIHNNTIVPVKTAGAFIVAGKVAGFDKADYGISDVTTLPLLYQDGNMLVATTQLSNCITGRFGPIRSWKNVWGFIMHWLSPGLNNPFSSWPSQLSPAYSRREKLPGNAAKHAVVEGSNWFYKARFLVDSSWEQLFMERTAKNGRGVVHPPVDAKAKIGNGSWGILEGQSSRIEQDGSQPYRWWIRADCQAETAQALALSAGYLHQPGLKKTATNLLDYLYRRSNLRDGPRNDPNSPSFGLVGWATTDADAYYGDDNARVILGTIGASAAMQTTNWYPYILEAILGNFRTAGTKGFRGNWFRDSTIQRLGWQALSDRDLVNIHPHYESWLWACYLWLYDKTGYTPLLQKAETAIRMTMEKYPGWKWTNGIQQERARMILPLAWLVRVRDTPQHRQWLKMIADELLKNLQDCGAIREEIGDAKNGQYGPVPSNAQYGVREAPLIARNGDQVADLLYTMNFAFFALNEAAHATKDTAYSKAVKKISDFFIRIQVKSDAHADLNGTWYRAFDYGQWDYWASNADDGWGPWCTETGWIQGWILSTLIRQEKNTSFWSETRQIDINTQARAMIASMLTRNKMPSPAAGK